MASADPTEFEEITEHSQDNYHSDHEVDPEAPTQVIEENGKLNKQVCINVSILLLNPPPSLKIREFSRCGGTQGHYFQYFLPNSLASSFQSFYRFTMI